MFTPELSGPETLAAARLQGAAVLQTLVSKKSGDRGRCVLERCVLENAVF